MFQHCDTGYYLDALTCEASPQNEYTLYSNGYVFNTRNHANIG